MHVGHEFDGVTENLFHKLLIAKADERFDAHLSRLRKEAK